MAGFRRFINTRISSQCGNQQNDDEDSQDPYSEYNDMSPPVVSRDFRTSTPRHQGYLPQPNFQMFHGLNNQGSQPSFRSVQRGTFAPSFFETQNRQTQNEPDSQIRLSTPIRNAQESDEMRPDAR